MKNTLHAIQSLFALSALVVAGCGGTTSSAYSYYDPYYYYSYYPADVYYSGYYWTDPYSVYYYVAIGAQSIVVGNHDAGGDAAVISDAGPSDAAVSDAAVSDAAVSDAAVSDGGSVGGISTFLTVGDAIRALSLGAQVCPNQVTITPKVGSDVCASTGTSMPVRNGVTIQFNNCVLTDGGRVNGTYDVQGTRTASDTACNANTVITLAITTTVTNLSYVGPGGRKLVIPSETGTSTLTYGIGKAPTSSGQNLTGQMQVFASNGSALLDNKFTGMQTVTPQDKTSYSIDGSLTLQDQLVVSAQTTLTAQGLTRTTSCCRPSAGTLTAVRTGASNGGTHTWSFGPACGDAKFDNASITLPASCL